MEYYDDQTYFKTVCCEHCGMENYYNAKKYDNMYFCDSECVLGMLTDIGSLKDIYIRVNEPKI